MYLQITTKCNMSCEHCCYSCSMRGNHGEYHTIVDGMAFASNYGEDITIGGGEPTLHPQFFDILQHCLEQFEYVWMATNGSQTKTMLRLSNIIDGDDWPECTCEEDDPEEYENYGCLCHEKLDDRRIFQEGRLSVALSLDCFHDPIDDRIENLWRSRAEAHGWSYYQIRNVMVSANGPIAQGRGKRTGAGYAEGCPCSDIIIKPDGKLRLCGCERAPVIGDVWSGISNEWEDIITGEKPLKNGKPYQDTNCSFSK